MSIYVLRYGSLIKVGFSGDLPSRVRSIMSSIPGDVTFVGHMPGDEQVEQHLHKRFESERFSGEWFIESDRVKAFCVIALDPDMPPHVDHRSAGLRARKKYPVETLELRSLATSLWPETDHKKRVDQLADELQWTRSRAKKLYYGEVAQMVREERDHVRALAAKIQARKKAMK